ncbi:MAG: CHRD domain-containing protein [Gammaproteobacteria bacterium]|nr:CHRD domain-containing protein [Gammaproteobacteria bacterium]
MKSDRRITTASIYIFALFAISACGGSSSNKNRPPPADTTAPTVSAVQAPAGTTVNRVVTLTATASDNVGVADVRFFLDGALLGNDTTAPYSFDWDTSAATDGDHVLRAEAADAAGNVTQSGDVTVTVRNTVEFTVTPSAQEEVSTIISQGTAQANLTINLVTGSVQGDLTVNGITPTAAHIHDAFAGVNGPVLVPLDQDAGDPSLFTVPAAATLDAAGVDRLLAGALYVNVHTAAAPGGELRGQILPEDFVLHFATLSGAAAVPKVDSVASGRVAVTVNQVTGALVVQARVQGLDDATQAHVHEAYAGAAGPVSVPLAQDPMNTGRWFVENASLNAAGLDAFAAGRLYVNVHSPANPSGEIRGQIVPQGIAVLFAELNGEQEVPAVDTRADGLAALTLDEAASLLTIHVNTNRLPDATASHLHGAFAGVNGGVEIGLTQDGSEPAHWFAEEAALSASQLAALLAGETYVNVHSPAHPGGEVRGQVIPDDILFAFGHLEGSQEIPAVTSTAGGTFAVTVDPATLTLVAHANTTGADDAIAAHLHAAYAGTSGGVAIGLTQDPTNVTRWSADNATLSADQLSAFRDGRFYVNVHTPAHPGGEIRGQVAPPPIEVLFTNLSGGQEVPAVNTVATGTAATTVNRESGTITLHLNTSNAATATASHIHLAYAGRNGGVLIGLEQDGADPGHWFAIGAQLDSDGLADYLAGRLYVNLHTPANPGGEIRGQIAPPPIDVLFTTPSGDQEVPPVASAATAIAASTVDREAGTVTLHLNTSGADDATASHIHRASAGQNGPVLIPLEQDLLDVGHWFVSGAQLDGAGLDYYRAGQLYVNLHTPANPGGEIRGQIVPPDAAEFDNEAPTVDLTSPVSPVSGTVTLDADATDNQGIVEVRFLVDGVLIDSDTSAPYSIDWDTTTVADGDVTLTAEAEDLAGNVGVSANVDVTVQNGAAVTLTQIQTMVFTPRCAGCHSGPTSDSLPSGMNLSSTASSHSALVNVLSLQADPPLDRVEPGDPDNSYLIRKLEGGPGISGSRMPQGGPFLDPPTVDMIRQWISDDAPNN